MVGWCRQYKGAARYSRLRTPTNNANRCPPIWSNKISHHTHPRENASYGIKSMDSFTMWPQQTKKKQNTIKSHSADAHTDTDTRHQKHASEHTLNRGVNLSPSISCLSSYSLSSTSRSPVKLCRAETKQCNAHTSHRTRKKRQFWESSSVRLMSHGKI